jgi:hypothetical protein
MQQQPSWIGVILVFAYFGFMIFWLPFASRRLEPKLRDAIGRRLGIRIVRGTGVKGGLNWQVEGKKQANKGCQLVMWEGIAVLILFIAPIFLALSVLGVLLFALSG